MKLYLVNLLPNLSLSSHYTSLSVSADLGPQSTIFFDKFKILEIPSSNCKNSSEVLMISRHNYQSFFFLFVFVLFCFVLFCVFTFAIILYLFLRIKKQLNSSGSAFSRRMRAFNPFEGLADQFPVTKQEEKYRKLRHTSSGSQFLQP